MISAIIVSAIVLICYKKKITIRADFSRDKGSIDKKPKDTEEYIEYTSVKFADDLSGVKIGFWIIYSAGLFLVGVWPEIAVLKLFDIVIDGELNIVCSYFCIYGFPLIGAVFLVNMRELTAPKIKCVHDKVRQYISWMPPDRTLLSADGFFGSIIVEGMTSPAKLEAVKNFRNRCFRDGSFDIAEAELYIRSVNALRESKGMEPSYENLFRRIKIEKTIKDIKTASENIENTTAKSMEQELREQLAQQTKDLLFEIFDYDRIVKKMDMQELKPLIKGCLKLYPKKADCKKIAGLFAGSCIAGGVFTRSGIEEIASVINEQAAELIFDENYMSLFDDYEWKTYTDKGRNTYRRRRSYGGDEILFDGNDMYNYNGEFVDYY